MINFRKDVVYNAILYILKKNGGSCDIHKVCKILYFADQKHLSKYGRTITGDTYIAMSYGPVPSNTEDMFKALRGNSYYFDKTLLQEARNLFGFTNGYVLVTKSDVDLDYLSDSDIECLDYAWNTYGSLNFGQLTEASHGHAWNDTVQGREISIDKIMSEAGDSDEYINYIVEQKKMHEQFIR